MTATTPLPPQNLEAEEWVLGAMMLSPAAIVACTEILRPDDFYRASHGTVFRAIADLDLRDSPVDAITVANHLDHQGSLDRAGGRERIVEIASIVPASANALHWAMIVREMAGLRGLIRVGNECVRMGYDRPGELPELMDAAEKAFFGLTADRDQGELAHLAGSLTETVRMMHDRRNDEVTGLPTGLRAVDELTAGLQPGNLIVVAARPSMGKSALSLGIAHHTARRDVPVAVFSLEMSKVEVTQRLLSLQTNIPLHKLRKPKDLIDPDWRTIHTASGLLEGWPIYVDDSGDLRITELRSRARRLKARLPGLALIVVDYLQLMVGDDRPENRVQEVSQISRGLKVLARELDMPVVVLSQLNRNLEHRTDKRPVLSDLRDSGAIEQDADVVIFLYRDAVYHEDTDNPAAAELIVAKHRNGPTETLHATWAKLTARFMDA